MLLLLTTSSLLLLFLISNLLPMPMCIAPNNAALLINAAIIAPATTQRSVWKDSVPVRIYAFHTEAYSSGSEVPAITIHLIAMNTINSTYHYLFSSR